MGEILTIIIGVLTSINIFALILMPICHEKDGVGFSFVNPLVIHDNLLVNWFGAWFLAIIANICLPIIAILYWIYKLCTVGR